MQEFKTANATVQRKANKIAKEAASQLDGLNLQKLIAKNNELWEKKYQEALKNYEQQMNKTEDQYRKELSDKSLVFQQETESLTNKHKSELETAMKQYQQLKSEHEADVKNLFENIGTLKFVKELRYFKQQWEENKTEKKRKKIAAAMANATK